jgi:NAD+ synthase (glutamine-hydrolysing)
MNATVGALEYNRVRAGEFCKQAAERGIELLIFPELVVSGYPPEDLIIKRHFVADCMNQIHCLATEVPASLHVLIGCPWVADQDDLERKPANAAVHLHEGRIAEVYEKMLLPNYGVFDEKRVFSPGVSPWILEIGNRRIAVHVCEDSWWTDRGPALLQKGESLDAIVNLSASPYHDDKLQAREDILRKTALTLHAPLIYANLVGGQDELVFDGASFVISADGTLAGRAPQFEEALFMVDLDRLGSTTTAPALGNLEEVYCALKTGLRDYVNKNRFERVIVALSGGIDSALVAALASDALGSERVVGLTMPSQYSSVETRSDAEALACNLGIEFLEVPIRGLFDDYLKELSPYWPDRPADTTEENLQARIRGSIVMAFSNKFGWLVLTTGNKSEIAVGYCTLYGDMVGGFAVIKDVPKTLVFALCRWRNEVSDTAVIPESTITRPPSAELRSDQKDTDTLPPYEILDEILEMYVEKDMAAEEIAQQGFDTDLVLRVIRMVDVNEYKRRQAAPGIKITPKAFGRDRRLPITNQYRDTISRPLGKPEQAI